MSKQEEINKLKARLDIIDSAILENLSTKTTIEKELKELEKVFEPQNGAFFISRFGRVSEKGGHHIPNIIRGHSFANFTNNKTAELAALSCLMSRMAWQFADGKSVSIVNRSGLPILGDDAQDLELGNMLEPIKKQIEGLLNEQYRNNS